MLNSNRHGQGVALFQQIGSPLHARIAAPGPMRKHKVSGGGVMPRMCDRAESGAALANSRAGGWWRTLCFPVGHVQLQHSSDPHAKNRMVRGGAPQHPAAHPAPPLPPFDQMRIRNQAGSRIGWRQSLRQSCGGGRSVQPPTSAPRAACKPSRYSESSAFSLLHAKAIGASARSHCSL